MAREFFKDLPNTTTPLTASRLNGLLDGEEAMGSIVVDDVNCKNMFDKGSFVSGDRKDAQPTIRISSRQVLYLEPGTYTFSTDLDTSVYRYEINTISSPAPVSSYDVLYGSGWKTTSTLTITIDNSTKGYFNLGVARINNSSLTISDISSANFQLEKGSTATEYIEYKQPVKKTSVGVKEDATFYANDFKSKNLFIPTKTNNGTDIALANATLSINDDEFVFVATGSDVYFGQIRNAGDSYNDSRGILIDVEGISSISYTITNPTFNQTYITRYDSSKKSLGYIFRALSSGSYDIPAGTKYITLRFGLNNATSGTTYKTKVQVEVGSATPYTPYKNFDNTPIITQLLSDTALTASTSYALSDAITNYKYIMLVLTSASTFENANRQYIPVEQIQGFNNLYRCALSVFQSTSVYMFADMYFADATHIYCNTLTRGTTGWAGHLKVYGIK